MKKALPIVIAIVAVLGGLVAVLLLRPADSAVPVTETMQTSTPVETPDSEPDAVAEPTEEPAPAAAMDPAQPTMGDEPVSSLASGRYVDYSSAVVAQSGYSETILFFHANWCPECRAFEQSIKAGTIPDGVQVVKVDYDNSDDLRQKYGVTIQTTFVKVNANGDRISSWVGYGRDKSLAAVLENT